MRRTEFLAELERLLADLPEEERQAAIQYYEDYLQDAGEENEQEVIRELGGPEKVAATIRADYYGNEFREEDYEKKDYMTKQPAEDSDGSTGKQAPWTSRRLKVLLVVLILLTVVPGILGGIGTAVCVVGAAALMIAGIAVTAAGIGLFFDVLPMALLVCGIGILLFVVGLIAVAAAVKLCAVVYPAMLRGFVNLCRRPFQRREA